MEGSGEGKGRVAAAPTGGGGYGAYEVAGERKWWPWLVPTIIVSCIAIFVFEMWVNDCPKHGSALGADAGCVAGFLRRFYFQPLRENPLLGPSSPIFVQDIILSTTCWRDIERRSCAARRQVMTTEALLSSAAAMSCTLLLRSPRCPDR